MKSYSIEVCIVRMSESKADPILLQHQAQSIEGLVENMFP